MKKYTTQNVLEAWRSEERRRARLYAAERNATIRHSENSQAAETQRKKSEGRHRNVLRFIQPLSHPSWQKHQLQGKKARMSTGSEITGRDAYAHIDERFQERYVFAVPPANSNIMTARTTRFT